MAWIKIIDEADADGDLKKIYNEQRQQAGTVANILKILSLAPDVLAAHLQSGSGFAGSTQLESTFPTGAQP